MNTEQWDLQALSADPSEWPSPLIAAIRDHHPKRRLRLWAAEEWSRRVEIMNLSPADVEAALDAQEAAAVAKDGAMIKRTQNRLKRQVAPRLMEHITSRAERFCRYANMEHGPSGFRDAGELLKRYLRVDVTMQEFCEIIDAHCLSRYEELHKCGGTPGLKRLVGTRKKGKDSVSFDDGGAIDGYQYLASLHWNGALFQRFLTCKVCGDLFYDAKSKWVKRQYCDKVGCKKTRWRNNQQHHRAKKHSSGDAAG